MAARLTAACLNRQAGDAAIGVDVGGTKTAVGLLDAASLSLLARTTIPTRRSNAGAAVLRDTKAQVEAMADRAIQDGRSVTGIGLAVPEIVDPGGRITSGAVIPGWNQLPVAETLGAVAPIRIEADVRAAAFAEAVLGAGQHLSYYLYLTVGTGISYSAVLDGAPVPGARGGALNIGTSVLADIPAAGPGTQQQLILEQVASGPALVERYTAAGATATSAEQVLAAAQDGDALAAAIVEEGARALGTAMALLVNLLDPEALIVGGGLGSADTRFWASAVSWARRRVYSDVARSLQILQAQLGADAGVIGAGLVGLLARVATQDKPVPTETP